MIIFLSGPDTFRSRQKLRELKEKFTKEVDASSINIQTIAGKTATLEAAENALVSAPFLSRKRMVIFDSISQSRLTEIQYGRIQELIRRQSAQDTIVIFWEGEAAGKKFSKHPFFSALAREKYSYAFDFLKEGALTAWIERRTKELGCAISQNTARTLSEILGNNLWRVNAELEKLSAYVKNGEITQSAVQLLVATEEEENIFLLTDAIGQKNKRAALLLIENFLKSGLDAQEILYRCLWQCKNLLLIKSFEEAKSAGVPPYLLSQKLGLHPYVVKKGISQAKNFTRQKLQELCQGILSIDEKIKTGVSSTPALIDLLILKS